MIDTIPFIGISIWLIIKIMVLILLVVYIVFAFIIVKQVNLMLDTLDVGLEIPLKGIAIFHLLFAVGTFILAVGLL
ncbi:hypothetical protein HY008_00420 [Candidatus Woesebacteria bacterium]|nr:hypothetical protein [Candidatus Woesebacteria bacterium]